MAKRTRLNNASGLLAGWPEKTSRLLISIIAVAILIGVPALSMTLMSVHVDRQMITIEPGSYRAFHFVFYGFGTITYRGWGSPSSNDVYIIELDRVNFYRFTSGRPYSDMGYETVGTGGEGYSSMSGMVLDQYLVLVNDGTNPATLQFQLDARAYFSLPPAIAILVFSGVAGYSLGRQNDKKALLDRTDPVVVARRPIRMRALMALAVLSLIPIVAMFGAAAATPPTSDLGMVTSMYGFFLGLLIASIVAFQLRFKLTRVPGSPRDVLANLAYRLRVSGYRVTDERNRLIVQISNTSSVHIMARKEPNGTLVIYKPSATPTGFSILIVLFFIFISAPIMLALSLFMLYRASAFAGLRVLPRTSQLPIPEPPAAKADTRAMIVESLSEGRRLSAEAHESARSDYQDSVVIMIILVLLLSFVLGGVTYGIMDIDQRGKIALAVGAFSGVVISAILWLLLAARARPQIAEFKRWTSKLDAALTREVSGQMLADGEPSSFELIVDSYKEMDKWLKVRRKAWGYRKPWLWLLIFFLCYGAFQTGMMGLLWLAEGQSAAGLVATVMCVVLVVFAILSYVLWKNRLDLEQEVTLADWRARYDALKSEMEKFLVGE